MASSTLEVNSGNSGAYHTHTHTHTKAHHHMAVIITALSNDMHGVNREGGHFKLMLMQISDKKPALFVGPYENSNGLDSP